MMSFCTPSIKDWGFDWSTSQLPFVHKYYLILSLPIRVSANSRNEQKASPYLNVHLVQSIPLNTHIDFSASPDKGRDPIRRSLFFFSPLICKYRRIQPVVVFFGSPIIRVGHPPKSKTSPKSFWDSVCPGPLPYSPLGSHPPHTSTFVVISIPVSYYKLRLLFVTVKNLSLRGSLEERNTKISRWELALGHALKTTFFLLRGCI